MKLIPRYPHKEINRAIESDAMSWLVSIGFLWMLWEIMREPRR